MTAQQRKDWLAWHDGYDDPGSPLARRLVTVRSMLRAALDAAPQGSLVLVSACAGQARDVLGVVPQHPRRHEITGRLVELDPRNAGIARAGLAELGVTGIGVFEADAGDTDAFLGVAPADVLLMCGVWGNVTDEDVHRTIAELPALVRPGGTVLWTRHRREPDLTPAIRRWFGEQGFTEVSYVPSDPAVGAQRYDGPAREFAPGRRLFRFVR